MILIKSSIIACLLVVSQWAVAGKIAVFDHQTAIISTDLAKKSIATLQADKEYSELMAKGQDLRTDLENMAKDLEKNRLTWNEDQVAENRKKIEYIQADLQLVSKKIQSANQALLGRVMKEIQPKLQSVLENMVKAEGIDVVLRRQNVYFNTPAIDITEKVTNALNKAK